MGRWRDAEVPSYEPLVAVAANGGAPSWRRRAPPAAAALLLLALLLVAAALLLLPALPLRPAVSSLEPGHQSSEGLIGLDEDEDGAAEAAGAGAGAGAEEPSEGNLSLTQMEDGIQRDSEPWQCWEKDWRKDKLVKLGDGFEYSDTGCPEECSASCRRPRTNCICSGTASAEEMKRADAELNELRAKYTAADWCGPPLPGATAAATVGELMEEFQRVDGLLRAVAGGPGAHVAHCYPGSPFKKKASSYCGPFIENHWIDKYYRRKFLCSPLNYVRTFGPFVPIFVQWVDTWVLHRDRFRHPPLIRTLAAVLQPGQFVYATLSQSMHGVCSPVKGEDLGVDMHGLAAKGLLAFSGGGMGQVPIPLLKQPEVPLEGNPPEELNFTSRLMGFAGNVWREPRQRLFKLLEASPDLEPGDLRKYHGPDWRWFHSTSRFCLAPRGFGRTSFTLFETIQLQSCVPVYLYDDFMWLPYLDSPRKPIEIRDNWVISVNISHAADLPKFLKSISNETYEEMRATLRQMLASHFTYAGVLKQVVGYLSKGHPHSDLKCRLPMPRTST